MQANKLKRSINKIQLKDKLLILCCGQTEYIYFSFLKHKFKSANITIMQSKRSQQSKIIFEAINLKSHFKEIWIVFDKDKEESSSFEKELTRAKKNKIHCAFSNRAFEYWLLLHFEYTLKCIEPSKLITELEKHLTFRYDKSIETINKLAREIQNKQEFALSNGRKSYEVQVKEHGQNASNWCSCTLVFLLIERMKKWGEV